MKSGRIVLTYTTAIQLNIKKAECEAVLEHLFTMEPHIPIAFITSLLLINAIVSHNHKEIKRVFLAKEIFISWNETDIDTGTYRKVYFHIGAFLTFGKKFNIGGGMRTAS